MGAFAWWWHIRAEGAKLFAQIHIGMSRSEIRQVLGPPRRIQPDDQGERWDYASLRLLDTRVWFDTNGLVSALGQK
jgi:outer membrane protein assembly factor BamE (lipoprotein component of BamABCDE complex)